MELIIIVWQSKPTDDFFDSLKRNDSLRDDIEVEAIHYYPENTLCDCCQGQMIEIGSKNVREDAEFIPAKKTPIVN